MFKTKSLIRRGQFWTRGQVDAEYAALENVTFADRPWWKRIWKRLFCGA